MQSDNRPNAPGYGYWLVGTALLVLMVLFVLPGTGGLARTQTGMLVAPPYALYGLLKDIGVKEIPGDGYVAPQPSAPTTSSDYSDALVSALAMPPGDSAQERRQRLHALLEKFPQHKIALYAHLLRYDTMSTIRLNRDAEIEPYLTGKPWTYTSKITPPTPEALAAFDTDAVAGEQADPDNAYFPMMRAVGLFAAHKDAEGLAAVERASNRPRYEDYCVEEADCRWQKLKRHGSPIAIAHLITTEMILFPHYAQLRAVARTTRYKAVQAEVAGRTEEGFAIRQATLRSGKLLRTQARTAIGNLVGIAIEALAQSSPNRERFGGLSEVEWKKLSGEQQNQKRLEFYCAYLEKIGHSDQAKRIVVENAACTETKNIISQGNNSIPLMEMGLRQLITDWSFSMAALANALAMLLLSGAMLILKKLKQDQENQPLLVVGILCMLLIVIAARMNWALSLNAVRSVLDSLHSMDDTAKTANQQLPEFVTSPIVIRIAVCFFSLLVPGVMLVMLGIKWQARRYESDSVLARSLQTTGSIVTLLLTLVYGYALFSTAQHEARFNAATERITQNEGRYYAEQLGKTWPP